MKSYFLKTLFLAGFLAATGLVASCDKDDEILSLDSSVVQQMQNPIIDVEMTSTWGATVTVTFPYKIDESSYYDSEWHFQSGEPRFYYKPKNSGEWKAITLESDSRVKYTGVLKNLEYDTEYQCYISNVTYEYEGARIGCTQENYKTFKTVKKEIDHPLIKEVVYRYDSWYNKPYASVYVSFPHSISNSSPRMLIQQKGSTSSSYNYLNIYDKDNNIYKSETDRLNYNTEYICYFENITYRHENGDYFDLDPDYKFEIKTLSETVVNKLENPDIDIKLTSDTEGTITITFPYPLRKNTAPEFRNYIPSYWEFIDISLKPLSDRIYVGNISKKYNEDDNGYMNFYINNIEYDLGNNNYYNISSKYISIELH